VALRSGAVAVVAGLLAAGTVSAGAAAGPVAGPGYHLTMFAAGSGYFNPDSVTSGRGHIFIGFQNATPPDGSAGTSTIVQYGMDGKVIRIEHPGRPSQRNEVLNIKAGGNPEELDDSAAATSREGFLLVADHDANTIYKLTKDGGFHRGQAYSQAPKGSPLAGVVVTLDVRSGNLSPVVTGFVNPTGLLFLPTGENEGGDDQSHQGGNDQGNQ
jgi:hypothetical protein